MIRSLILVFILGIPFGAFAQGNLLITPTRVVFDGNKQREELNLVNLGKDTATYSISFVQKNMKQDGSFVMVEKSDSNLFADPYLRIYPRQVVLAPREPQVIILQCRRKADMPPGEYRSHLYFRAEKDLKVLGLIESACDTARLSIQLIPIFGLSIPIIIRVGTMHAGSQLSDLRLQTLENANTLHLTISRTGNCSIYGDLIVEYKPANGKLFQVGRLTGVGVYTNIQKRQVAIKLNKVPGIIFKTGDLRVRYTSADDAKYLVYAESNLTLKTYVSEITQLGTK